MRVSPLLAGFFGLAAYARPASAQGLVVVEDLGDTPNGWQAVGAPDPNQKMFFRIAMHSPNHELFEQTLANISNPAHDSYGQYLKQSQLKDMLRPSQDATGAVLSWLQQSGIAANDIEDKGEWINFHATVAQAETMMGTTFQHYSSSKSDSATKIRTLQYSVPSHLVDHIDMIQPTTRFAQIIPRFVNVAPGLVVGTDGASPTASCNNAVNPTCLRSLYNITGYTPSGDIKKTGFMGVNGFLNQWARFSDLATFEQDYATWADGANFTWTSINGGTLDQTGSQDSTEANLDVQYALSLSYPLPIEFYSTGGVGELVPDLDEPSQSDNQNEPYLDMFTYINDLPDGQLPHTISTSYGEDEQSVPAAYAQKVCNLIGQLGSRGVSVIFSSGDTGVGSACQTNDGKNTTRFLPIFPAACPYVTSVGATSGTNPESATTFSSGGFSDRWPQPWWQADLVNAYLKGLGSQWSGLYNPAGRGFPDVAAQGENYEVINQGRRVRVDGTSCSAPTFAAIVGLLNSARLESGQSPLGFLNPWLYQTASPANALNDVTNGGSTGCTGTDNYSGLSTPYVPGASWAAVKGWDPVTGLGTPNFGKLLPLALKVNSSGTATNGFYKI